FLRSDVILATQKRPQVNPYSRDKQMTLVILAPAYFLLGSGVKYVDAAYDDGTFSKRYTFLLAILLGVLAGVAMIVDFPTFIMFLSLIIGVAITGKLDILPFRILTVIAVSLALYYHNYSLPFSASNWTLLLLLSVGAAIDEIG